MWRKKRVIELEKSIKNVFTARNKKKSETIGKGHQKRGTEKLHNGYVTKYFCSTMTLQFYSVTEPLLSSYFIDTLKRNMRKKYSRLHAFLAVMGFAGSR